MPRPLACTDGIVRSTRQGRGADSSRREDERHGEAGETRGQCEYGGRGRIRL